MTSQRSNESADERFEMLYQMLVEIDGPVAERAARILASIQAELAALKGLRATGMDGDTYNSELEAENAALRKSEYEAQKALELAVSELAEARELLVLAAQRDERGDRARLRKAARAFLQRTEKPDGCSMNDGVGDPTQEGGADGL